RTPDSMAPFQLVINHNSLDGVFCWWSKEGLQRTSGFGSPGPHDPSAAIGVHIDDNLIAVPRLNRRGNAHESELTSTGPKHSFFDLARTAIARRICLVPLADFVFSPRPVGLAAQRCDALIAR